MKTIKKTIYVTFLCLSVILASCSSDDNNDGDGGDDGTGGAEYLTAKVDGNNWSASTDLESLIGAGTSNNGTVMTVQGSTNTGDYIQIVIQNYDGVGTYRTGDDINNMNSLSYGELVGTTSIDLWSNGFVTAILGGIGAGEIVVESDSNGVVVGTFTFKGYNAEDESTKNVTVGKFKANIN